MKHDLFVIVIWSFCQSWQISTFKRMFHCMSSLRKNIIFVYANFYVTRCFILHIFEGFLSPVIIIHWWRIMNFRYIFCRLKGDFWFGYQRFEIIDFLKVEFSQIIIKTPVLFEMSLSFSVTQHYFFWAPLLNAPV